MDCPSVPATGPSHSAGRIGGRQRDGRLNPGEFHLLTHGDLNTPRWLQTFDEVTLVLDRQFVADVVRDGLPADRVEFATQRSASMRPLPPTPRRFVASSRPMLPMARSTRTTLTVGFTLHLLSNYGIAKPKIPLPRGKLNSWQLRAVVDFIQAHLDDNVPLLALADRARVSPFHFARLFRATVGLPPHQFVLRQRVQRSLRSHQGWKASAGPNRRRSRASMTRRISRGPFAECSARRPPRIPLDGSSRIGLRKFLQERALAVGATVDACSLKTSPIVSPS